METRKIYITTTTIYAMKFRAEDEIECLAAKMELVSAYLAAPLGMAFRLLGEGIACTILYGLSLFLLLQIAYRTFAHKGNAKK